MLAAFDVGHGEGVIETRCRGHAEEFQRLLEVALAIGFHSLLEFSKTRRSGIRLGTEDGKDFHRERLAFHRDQVGHAAEEEILHVVMNFSADDEIDAVFLGRAFETGGEVHTVANDGEVHLLMGSLGADVAEDDIALMDANAELEFVHAAGEPVLVEFIQR